MYYFPAQVHGLLEFYTQALWGARPGAWLRPPERAWVWEKRSVGFQVRVAVNQG